MIKNLLPEDGAKVSVLGFGAKQLLDAHEQDKVKGTHDTKAWTKWERDYLLTYPTPVCFCVGGDFDDYAVKTFHIMWDGGEKTVETSESSTFVYNLEIGRKYEWYVEYAGERSETTVFTTADEYPRMIRLGRNCPNVRDFGGLWNIHGRRVKQGLMYRGCAIDEFELDPTGVDVYLNDLKIKSDFDMRDLDFKDVNRHYEGHPDVNVRVDRYHFRAGSYGGPVENEEQMRVTANIMEKLCDKSVYPVYLHCSVGTDRTGTLMFLLGLLLKIDLESLFLDYELSSLSQNFYHWAGRGRENFERDVIPVIERYGDEGDDIYACTEKFFDKALGLPGVADKLAEIFFEDAALPTCGYNYIKDIEYGGHERQKFDLCLPGEAKHPEGLILFIHGGAWIGGCKEDYEYEMPSWAAKGYICAAMNYHYVSDDVHMDTLMEDVGLAVAKIKETAAGYGFDLKKCLLTGTSAGAHMSLLYAYKHGRDSAIRPVAVVDCCGPVDLTSKLYTFGNRMGGPDYMKKLMGNVCGYAVDPADLEKTREPLLEYSPIRFTDGAVPTVIAHGMKDSIVPFLDAEELDCKLTSLGVPHDFVIYPNSDHDLWADRDCRRETQRLFDEYADKYL